MDHPTGITMDSLKARFPQDQRASARAAFGALDGDLDQYLGREEFAAAATRLSPALSPEEATEAFIRLDTNGDGRVESLEFFMAFEADMFLRPAGAAHGVLLTVEEYRARMGGFDHAELVTVEVPAVDPQTLSPREMDSVHEELLAGIAQLGGAKKDKVRDVRGHAGAVSVSSVFAVGHGGKRGLRAQAIVHVPPTVPRSDVVAVLGSESSAHYIATRLSTALRDRKEAITRHDVTVTVSASPSGAFHKADKDDDGFVNKDEFLAAGGTFTPPLTPTEGAFAFEGLDVTGAGRLTAEQFMAVGYSSIDPKDKRRGPTTTVTTTKVPSTSSSPAPRGTATSDPDGKLTMADLLARMGKAFPSTEDTFVACDAGGDGALTRAEFRDCAGLFRPTLSHATTEYAFAGLDGDSNGEVSRADFLAAIKAGKLYASENELRDAAGGAGDGHISLEDFKERLDAFEEAQAAKSESARRLTADGAAGHSFHTLDTNGDGKVDSAEFQTDLDSFRPRLGKLEGEFVFGRLDEDGDGTISANEFSRRMQVGTFGGDTRDGKAYVTLGELKHAFNTDSETPTQLFGSLDPDNDGYSTHAEFVRGGLARGLAARQAAYTFRALDANGDLAVSPQEMFAVLRQGGSQRSPITAPVADLAPARKATDGAGMLPVFAAPGGASPPITVPAFEQRMAGISAQDAFLQLDSNGDGFLEPTDLIGTAAAHTFHPRLGAAEASYAFRGLDASGDGFVCIAEFFGTLRLGAFGQTPDALRAIGAVVKSRAPAGGRAPGAAVEAAEAEEDPASDMRQVDFQVRVARPTAEDVFAEVDENGDAVLDRSEYSRRAPGCFLPPLTQAEADHTFSGMDADQDGRLTPTEYFGTFKLGHFFLSAQALQRAEKQALPTGRLALPARAPEGPAEPPPAPHEAPATPGDDGSNEWRSPITLAEFVRRMKVKFPSPQGAFRGMTHGHHKGLEFADFGQGVRRFSPALSDAQAMFSFKGLDANKDKVITEEEFRGDLSLGHFFEAPKKVAEAFRAIKKKEDGYECEADLQNWSLGWSDGKKKWCCEHSESFKANCPQVREEEAKRLTLNRVMQRLGPEIHNPEDVFHSYDLDRDGGIELEELRKKLRDFRPPLTEEEAKVVIAGLDGNFDGQVRIEELVRAMQTRRWYGGSAESKSKVNVWQAPAHQMTLESFAARMPHESPLAAFRSMDGDGDDQLSEAEFQDGVTVFDKPLVPDEFQYAYAGLDVNGDGSVDAQEFQGAFKVGRFYATPEALEEVGVSVRTTDRPLRPAATTTAPRALDAAPVPQPAAPPRTTTTTTTVTRRPWTLHKASLSLPQFQQRMGDRIPRSLAVLSSHAGGCVELDAFRAAAKDFDPPLESAEVDYAFCGMDVDFDRRVCSFEFFGTMKIGHFFPSQRHLDGLREMNVLRQRDGEMQVEGGVALGS